MTPRPRTVRRRRFAEGTTVDVSKSRMQIESLLIKGGATQIVIGFDRESRGFVHFSLDARQYRFLLPQRSSKRAAAQVDRENWRTLVLFIKAKLEAIASELVTAEQELLAWLVLPNGKTLGSEIEIAIERIYQSGTMQPLLPESTRGAA